MEVNRTHGGCATFVKNGLQYRRVGIKGNLECIAVEEWDSQNHWGRANSTHNDNGDGNNTAGEKGNSGVGSNNRKSVDVMEKVRCVVIWDGDLCMHITPYGAVCKGTVTGLLYRTF